MTLWTLFKKETRIILRSRMLLGVLLIYPLVLVGIIGFAFSEPQRHVPIALINEDVDANGQPRVELIPNPIQGRPSERTFSSALIIANLTEIADLHYTTLEEGRHLLLTGEVEAVVRFPANFARDVVNYGSSSQIQIITDQSDIVRARIMEISIRGAIQSLQDYIITQKVDLVIQTIDESLGFVSDPSNALYPGFPGVRQRCEEIRTSKANLSQSQRDDLAACVEFMDTIQGTLRNSRGLVQSVAQPIQVRVDQERSGSLFVRDLIVPAALALGIFWTGSLATSSLVVYERESPAYQRLRLSPAGVLAIYGSKILLTVLIILGQSLLILAIAIVTWHTRVDNPALTLAVVLLSTAAAIGLGLFLASLSRDVTGTVLLSVLITFPMLFLGGVFYPVSFMPPAARFVAGLFPLTHSVAALRGSMLRGFGFEAALPWLTALAAFGFVLGTLGIILGRRLELRR